MESDWGLRDPVYYAANDSGRTELGDRVAWFEGGVREVLGENKETSDNLRRLVTEGTNEGGTVFGALPYYVLFNYLREMERYSSQSCVFELESGRQSSPYPG